MTGFSEMPTLRHRCSSCGQDWVGTHSCVVTYPKEPPTIGDKLAGIRAAEVLAIRRDGYRAGVLAAAAVVDCAHEDCEDWVREEDRGPNGTAVSGFCPRYDNCRWAMAEAIRALAKEATT